MTTKNKRFKISVWFLSHLLWDFSEPSWYFTRKPTLHRSMFEAISEKKKLNKDQNHKGFILLLVRLKGKRKNKSITYPWPYFKIMKLKSSSWLIDSSWTFKRCVLMAVDDEMRPRLGFFFFDGWCVWSKQICGRRSIWSIFFRCIV